MIWKQENWPIKKLVDLYKNKKINLSPDYQRNSIWTVKAQKQLIDTILTPQPIPNFFLLKIENDRYEVVDGQQRARTFISFLANLIPSSKGVNFQELPEKTSFLDYPLNITIILELAAGEVVEDFYTLVNSSGLRLNVPEIRKAKYYDTKFLELATTLAASPGFVTLDLFGSGTINRMNDIELVSELLGLLHSGIADKKNTIEKLYNEDITEEISNKLRSDFNRIVGILGHMNKLYPIKKTRYKQRADLYSLFAFIFKHNLNHESFDKYYKILLLIEPHIRPTQDRCDSLRDYARNCVSQSNGLIAREARAKFLNDLLRGNDSTPNETQMDVMRFLELPDSLIEISGAWTVDTRDIQVEGCDVPK